MASAFTDGNDTAVLAAVRPESPPSVAAPLRTLLLLWAMHAMMGVASACFCVPYPFGMVSVTLAGHLAVMGLLCSTLGAALHPRRLRFLLMVVGSATLVPAVLTAACVYVARSKESYPVQWFAASMSFLLVASLVAFVAAFIASIPLVVAEVVHRVAALAIRKPSASERCAAGSQFTIRQLLGLTAIVALYLLLVRNFRDGLQATTAWPMLPALSLPSFCYLVVIPVVALWSTLTLRWPALKASCGFISCVAIGLSPYFVFVPTWYESDGLLIGGMTNAVVGYAVVWFASLLLVRAHGFRLVYVEIRSLGSR